MSAVSRGHLSHSIFAYRGRLLKNTLKQHFKHVLKIFSAQLFLTFFPHFRKWSQIVKGGIGQILKQEICVALKTHQTSRLSNKLLVHPHGWNEIFMYLCRSLASSVINYLQQEQVLALSASLLSTLCLLLFRQSFPSLLSTVCAGFCF